MTLSSSSRQHRKSMLPTPRTSSRISSRRTTSGDTSRIARRVPSPMLATQASFISGSTIHSRVPHPAASRGLPPPEFGTRRACSPSRIPSPLVQTSFPTPEQSETSSPASTSGSAEAPYPTPPASVETKHERSNGQEGRAKDWTFVQHQYTGTRCPAPPARHPSRRQESTALTSFSRTENSAPGDTATHPFAHKNLKLATTSSVSGKENRRPPARARVLVPAVVVPPRPIQRTTVSHIPISETSPRPLVIKKKLPHPLMTNPGQVKSAAEPAVVPAGIKALIGDLDRFAKEWTGMFDELLPSAGRHGDELANASTRIHSIVEETSEADDLGGQTVNSESGRTAGGTRTTSDRGQLGEMTAVPLTPSASARSIGTIQASSFSSTDGEPDNFDVSAASLVRWQHRDNTMLKDAPTMADMFPAVKSTSDSHTDTTAHHYSDLRSVPQLPTTPRAPRFIPSLPEINQSPIISGPHLVEMTSAVLSNRKDEPPPTPTRGTEPTRRNASWRLYPHSMAPLSSSPSPITTSLFSVSIPHTSSPLAHQRLHDSPPQRTALASDVTPTRSASLRGLRAIFKRTSAGLISGQRQRAESLKELIGEPRVLSLGSVSITNLRDAGIPGAGALTKDDADNLGEPARKTTAKW